MGVLSFQKHQKDTFILPLTLTDNAGTAIDLTGAEILFRLADYTHGTEGVVIGREDAAGKITISVHYNLMDTLKLDQNHRVGVAIRWPNDTRLTVLDGWLELTPKAADSVVLGVPAE